MIMSSSAWAARQERERRVERRFQIIQLLGKEWQYFRLLQEAALARPDKPVGIDQDLAQRYYRSEQEILSRLREMEKLGLVEVLEDSGGETHAYLLAQSDEVGKAFLETLFA